MTFACSNDKEPLVEKAGKTGLIIKTGTICGWCTVNDTLTIQENTVRYVNYTGCSTNTKFENIGEIKTSELNTLLTKLDFEEFKKLNLNSCDVCVDGCDEWIFVDNGSESHYIRFVNGEPKLNAIQSFVDELYTIKAKYSGNK
jgi:hypothetical protein